MTASSLENGIPPHLLLEDANRAVLIACSNTSIILHEYLASETTDAWTRGSHSPNHHSGTLELLGPAPTRTVQCRQPLSPLSLMRRESLVSP